MTISTSDLGGLPDLGGFRRLCKSLAALDAVLSPEWEYRFFSFDAGWNQAAGEMMAIMRDGSGDEWFAIISRSGIALRGLAHEASTFKAGTPKPWVLRDLPEEFHANLLNEPAADTANSTYCIWRLVSDASWHCGVARGQPVEDGSVEHMAILSGDPNAYVAMAEEQYDMEVRLDDVRAVYDHRPLTRELVARLNPEADWDALMVDLKKIGYPESR
jgi:hypothetical protein